MKLENWNKWDKAPAKTRFVKNEIEFSERRMRFMLDGKIGKMKKEMTRLVATSIAISIVGIIILLRYGKCLGHLRKLPSGSRKDIL